MRRNRYRRRNLISKRILSRVREFALVNHAQLELLATNNTILARCNVLIEPALLLIRKPESLRGINIPSSESV